MNLHASVFCDCLFFLKRFDFDKLQMSSRRLRSIVEAHLNSSMRHIKIALSSPKFTKLLWQGGSLEFASETPHRFLRHLNGCHVDEVRIVGFRNVTNSLVQLFMKVAKNLSVESLAFHNVHFDVSRQLLYRLVENFKAVGKLAFNRCLMTFNHLKDGTIGLCAERGITHLAIRQTRLCPTTAMTDDKCIFNFCLKAANASQDRKLEWQRANITSNFLGDFVKTRVAGLFATNVHVRLTPSARNRKFRQQNTEPLKRLFDIEPLFERMTHSAASTEEFFDFPQLGMSIRFDPEAELVIKCGFYYY